MTASPAPATEARIEHRGTHHSAVFTALGGPGRIHLHHPDPRHARQRLQVALAEIRRIEAKFSRYRDDSVIGHINRHSGETIEVDAETAALLDLAATAHRLSGGRFDITAGVLNRAWPIRGQRRPPSRRLIAELLPRVGWSKVRWANPRLRLPLGMCLDLGGLGKEYAADRALACLPSPALVELGGDLVANAPPPEGAWPVTLAHPDHHHPIAELPLVRGALATSGDGERAFTHQGRRYSHLLDPRSGRPIQGAPRSITVHAATCLEAGLLATLAMLHGPEAEAFLAAQGQPHWCLRDDVPEFPVFPQTSHP